MLSIAKDGAERQPLPCRKVEFPASNDRASRRHNHRTGIRPNIAAVRRGMNTADREILPPVRVKFVVRDKNAPGHSRCGELHVPASEQSRLAGSLNRQNVSFGRPWRSRIEGHRKEAGILDVLLSVDCSSR